VSAISLGDKVIGSRVVTDKTGRKFRLTSGISREEGEFVSKLIRENPITRSIEVGCAFGISSLYICDALGGRPEAKQVIIDPFELTEWHGIGLHNLEQAGLSGYEFIDRPSEFALPALLESRRRFDFALIDGFHRFEHALLDFFYLDRLLNIGGLLVFDDARLPPVRKVLRYVCNFPNYRMVGAVDVPGRKGTWQRRLLNCIKHGIHLAMKPIPKRLLCEMFDDSIVRPDRLLKLDASMIAFRKTSPDQRPGCWYIPF